MFSDDVSSVGNGVCANNVTEVGSQAEYVQEGIGRISRKNYGRKEGRE